MECGPDSQGVLATAFTAIFYKFGRSPRPSVDSSDTDQYTFLSYNGSLETNICLELNVSFALKKKREVNKINKKSIISSFVSHGFIIKMTHTFNQFFKNIKWMGYYLFYHLIYMNKKLTEHVKTSIRMVSVCMSRQ